MAELYDEKDKQKLERIVRSKQIVRTDRLLSILRKYGFDTRRRSGGSSHIMVYNTLYQEIPVFTVISGTKKRDSQANAAKACLEVIRLDEEQNTDIGDLFNRDEVDVMGAFARVTTENPDPPDDVEIIQGRKPPHKTFLRHIEFPQIATEILGDDTPPATEQVNYIRQRAEKLKEALRVATEEHDFEVKRYPNGTIILMHPCYEIDAALYPFTPRLENFTQISVVEDMIAESQLEYEAGQARLQQIIKYFDIEPVETDQESTLTFKVVKGFDAFSKELLSMPSTRNGHINEIDLITLVRDLENFTWYSFSKDIKKRYGFETQTNENGVVTGTHPFHDLTFEIDTSDLMSPLDDLIDGFDDLTEEEKEIARNDFAKVFDQYRARAKMMQKVMSQHNEIMAPRAKEMESLLIKGFNANTDSKFQPGKVITMRFNVGGFYATGNVIIVWGFEQDPFGNITSNRIKKSMPSIEALNSVREARKKYDAQQNPETKFSTPTVPTKKRVVVGEEFPSIIATVTKGMTPKADTPEPPPFLMGAAKPKPSK